jgi:UDP-glucose 4-epimerase
MHGCSRILVTGGAGFIGSHLVDRLLEECVDVIILDNLLNGQLKNINQHFGKKNFRFVQGDIRDYQLVSTLIKDVDAVIHLAAQISPSASIENPVLTNDINVNGTLNLLKASTDSNVKRFVFASSSAVYGDVRTSPIKEECLPTPLSPYGVSKLAGEAYTLVFHKVYGLETVCLRYFNVYGPRQTYNDYSGVITKFMNRIKSNLPPIIFGDGNQSRDFVHIQDVVEANVKALENETAVGETVNIATGVATTINQLAHLLLASADKPHLKVQYSESHIGDIRNSVGDVIKAQSLLHYSAEFSLKEGLKELLEHYKY